ncbi:glycosyltransferase [Geodermatophilus sp. DSM 45219]|uniref:glycosyltransferase n=1 Tax=Geodermatophilus sp. DSM 45219 TaxID=1881103 RepID=UPI00087F5928|nr:glycosyltransferase [Geodermatophilus sp. DSM 45219]SDN96570.1 Glycosyltransferase Family 4 [Geodermatophilus sp. DSM 45219]
MDPADPPATPGIRVVTVPYADPYVDAVLPEDVVAVGPGTGPSPWLDPGYLAAHAGGVDVVHLHDGYGHLPEDEVVSWTETLRRTGVPLVLTVHQLRDPRQSTRRRHDAHLEALLATAEVVLTLTPGAADEIAARFGRTAIVVAHPSIAEPVPGLGAERGLVGLPLRAPCAALPDPAMLVRAALSGAVNGGGRLRVFLDDGVEAPPVFAAGDSLEYRPRKADSWTAQLQELHAVVLPECNGTHSAELEVCRDVGTRVVAPSCGWFAHQWSDVVTYDNDEERGLDPVSLDAAVAAALTRPAPRPADRAWRTEQRAAVRAVHAQVYAQVVADRTR